MRTQGGALVKSVPDPSENKKPIELKGHVKSKNPSMNLDNLLPKNSSLTHTFQSSSPKAQCFTPKAQTVALKVQTRLPKSPMVAPLTVPKPPVSKAKVLVDRVGETEMPTLHIPQTKDRPAADPRTTQGHPGLPNGLLWMTSSLMHKSNAKMALKDTRVTPISRKMPLMQKLTPLTITYDSPSKLVSQVPVKQLEDHSFRASIEKSLENESGSSRSRLQLKPATSPKLRVEQCSMVPPSSVPRPFPPGRPPKLSTLRQDQSPTRSSLGQKGEGKGASSMIAEKKVRKERRSGGSNKAVTLLPWSKRSKEAPKNSGGWSWKGEGAVAKVLLNVSLIVWSL